MLQVPAPSAAVGKIIGPKGAVIKNLGRSVENLVTADMQKIPNEPRSGDVWFLVDARHPVRACLATWEIENIIIGS